MEKKWVRNKTQEYKKLFFKNEISSCRYFKFDWHFLNCRQKTAHAYHDPISQNIINEK